ncbi:hypothetical protein BGY98DRAFT_152955 [Russula aff. rugulosa BPL654]|nr:hypothetical protein BGY98DRAFT_152955 [Russula aff. rugulosa BPL654]
MSSNVNPIDLGPDAAYYIWLSTFYDLPAAVMLYYDYFLTLPREIQFLWPPHNKQGWFTLTCLLNRYIPMIGVMPVAISYFFPVNPSVRPCAGLHAYREWFMVSVQAHAGVICLLRVYALYGRSRRILVLLIFFAMGSFVTAFVSLFLDRKAGDETIPVISPFGGCAQYTPMTGGRFSAIAWAGGFAGDTAIFFLTLYKAFTIGRGVKLLDVLVRDGTMYFSALSLMNLGNIMTLLFAPPLLKTSITSYTNVLATILVNRLVLNLRERAATNRLSTTVESAGRFRRPYQSMSHDNWCQKHPLLPVEFPPFSDKMCRRRQRQRHMNRLQACQLQLTISDHGHNWVCCRWHNG